MRVTGYEDTEYSLLNHNGILDELMMLPGYMNTDVLSPYDVSKLTAKNYLYVRATIPWKLSCEHNETYPMSR